MRIKTAIIALLLVSSACASPATTTAPEAATGTSSPIPSSPSPEANTATATTEPTSSPTPTPTNIPAPILSVPVWKTTLPLPKGFEYEYAPESLAWSPDSKTFASGSLSGVVAIWDRNAEKMIHSMWVRRELVYSLAYSPDGQRLASGDGEGVIQVWTSEGTLLKTMEGHTNSVIGMAWSPDSERLYTYSYDNTFRVWDMTTYKELLSITGEFTPKGGSNFMDMTLSPDGNTIAMALFNQAVEIRDPATGDIRQTLTGFSGRVQKVSFSPDGGHLFVRTYDGQMSLLDTRNWQIQWNAVGLAGPVYSVAWSPDGNFLATGTLSEQAVIWNAFDGSLAHKLQRSGVEAISWSPDGDLLAFATADGIDLWSIEIQPQK